jgi:hypothetical protein
MDALKNSPLRDNFESLTNHSMPSLKQALEILHHPKEGENLAQIEAFKHTMGKLDLRFFPVKCFVLWRLIDIQGDTFPNHLCRFLSHQNIG